MKRKLVKENIMELSSEERQLILLLKTKRFGCFKAYVQNSIVTRVEVTAPNCFNCFDPGVISISQQDRRLIESLRFLDFGSLSFEIENGEFKCLYSGFAFNNAGLKSYLLTENAPQKELEIYGEKEYNDDKSFAREKPNEIVLRSKSRK